MKLSIHTVARGKPEVRYEGTKKTYWMGDQKVNLGYDWTNVEADFDDVFELLTVDGIAIAPSILDNPRSAANFESCEIALVDVDSRMTIDELLENEFYKEFAAGFYTTPSHKESDHRFRILHRLETPITHPERMRKLYCGLMMAYGNADQSCKDAARLFFGTINAERKEKRDVFLTDDAVDYLVSTITKQESAAVKNDTTVYKPLTDINKKYIVDKLKACYVGEYTTWRNIGWGMKSGGFSLEDFQYVTAGMMSKKSAADAKTVWQDGSTNGKVTMGTVVFFLKQRYGESFALMPDENRFNTLVTEIYNKKFDERKQAKLREAEEKIKEARAKLKELREQKS